MNGPCSGESQVKFEILKSSAAQPYRWRIVASNGQVLATSENYASEQSAKSACESVKMSAVSADIVDLTWRSLAGRAA